MTVWDKIVAFFMAILAFFSSLFGGGTVKNEPELDLDKFELVWADEFDSTEIDRSKWQMPGYTMTRKGGYWNCALAEVKDGELVISAKYLENGVNPGDPAGWYSARMRTKDLFEQTYGYFEVRCMLPEGYGLWSAFWLQNYDAMDNAYPDGSYGSEIDVFESPFFGSDDPNRVQGAVHWGGYGDAHQTVSFATDDLGVDLYNTYNTYGLEWNEDSYTYYFNGKAIGTFDKSTLVPSQAPEHLILSVEMNGENGMPGDGWASGTVEDNGREFVGEFRIDYVRVYQYQ